jgi:2-polyprenyl-3-methyl-5-hydroxy-6-metoxy-1,4-benzoquinol methylase
VIQLYDTYERHIGRMSGPVAPEAPPAPDVRMPAWMPRGRDAAVLDLGCGFPTRLWTLHRMGFGNLHGVDLRRSVIETARCRMPAGIQLHAGDLFHYLETCPLSFDRILLFHVLEHFSKPDGLRLLRLVASRLAPGGRAVLEVPNLSNVLGGHMQWSDLTHETAFTEFSLAQLLEAAGFASVNVVCGVPKRTGPWRPFRGTTLRWRANRLLHSALFRITGVGPRPRCTCPCLLMTASPKCV